MKIQAISNVPPIWRLYWLLSIITISLSLLIARYFYSDVLDGKFRDLDQFNTLVKEGWVESRLFAQESVLRVLSERLVEMDAIAHPDYSLNLLDSRVKNSANIIGMGLFDSEGNLIIATHSSKEKFPNLKQNSATVSTFIDTLNRNHMVLGHTYYNPFFDKWILPLRLAFRSPEGKQYVVASWLDAESGNALFNHDNIPDDIASAVISNDYYMLDYKINYPRDTLFFQVPLPEAVVDQFNLRKLKGKQRILQPYIDRNEHLRYISVTYIPKYEIYISLTRAHREAIKGFTPIAKKIALATLFFCLILYLFFYIVSKKEKKAIAALEYQAKHDSVTGLMNRFAISQQIGIYIAKEKQFCLAFVDLDNFKTVNDLYGHRTGDKVLTQVAERLLTVIEDDIHCARFSGDEFALIIPHVPEKAVDVYLNVLELIKLPFDLEYNALRISASMGVTVFPTDSDNSEELMRFADIALHQAKKQKDRLTFFDQDFYKKIERKSIIREFFNSALERDEFYIAYQPQIDIKSNSVIGVEALARWNSHDLGEISPAEFIPIAEEAGFIIPLGMHILENACKTTQNLWKQTNQEFKLSVNVSVRQLVDENFIANVSKIINKLKFPYEKLILEVTESIMIDDSDKIIQTLQILLDQGIGISLDDFGTGFSSLSMVSKLPITELKIDQSFVYNLLVDEDSAHLSEIIIQIGQHLNLDIIAEGVEEKEHVELLKQCGCHILQGYYFSKPLNVEDLIAYLLEENIKSESKCL
ncbi:MAG: EAL domain-containing protein [Candidatus Thiodiazotropha sp. DIVDIV]